MSGTAPSPGQGIGVAAQGSNNSNKYLSISPSFIVRTKGTDEGGNTVDVVFRIARRRGSRSWYITSDNVDDLIIEIRKPTNVRSKLSKIVTKLRNAGIRVDPLQLLDAFENQFISKYNNIRMLPSSSNEVIKVKLPLTYVEEVGIPFALTYRVYEMEGGKRIFKPLLLYMEGGEPREVELLDVLDDGLLINNRILLFSAYAFRDVEDEWAASDVMADIIIKLDSTIPSADKLLFWINELRRIGGNNLMELLKKYVRWKASVMERYLWPGFPDFVRKALSLVSAVGIVIGVSHFVFPILFTSPVPGSGKSYTMAVLSAPMAYVYQVESATPAALARLMSNANVVVLDDPTQREDLVRVIIQAYRRRAENVIADKEGRGTIEMSLGSIVMLPDIGGMIRKYDPTGAFISRAFIVYIVKDRRMAKIFDPFYHIRRERINLKDALGIDVEVELRELGFIDTAFFLLLAPKLSELYNAFIGEVNKNAEDGRNKYDPRALQSLAALIVLARIAGEEYEDAVWRYIEWMSNEKNRLNVSRYDMLAEVADRLVEEASEVVERDLLNIVEPYAYVFEGDDPIILLRMRGIKMAADRLFRGGDEDRIREFTDENEISRFINSDVILSQLVLYAKAKNVRNGRKYPHLAITSEVPEVIEAVKEGNTEYARKLVEDVRKKVCEALRDKVCDGEIEVPGCKCNEEEKEGQEQQVGSEGGASTNTQVPSQQQPEGVANPPGGTNNNVVSESVPAGGGGTSATASEPGQESQGQTTLPEDYKAVVHRSEVQNVLRRLVERIEREEGGESP